MEKAFLKFFFLVLLSLNISISFGQDIQSDFDKELISKNRVKQINIINTEIDSFKVKSIDTSFGVDKFNKEGQIIEQKYSIGSHIKHLYFYNKKCKVISEVRLAANFTWDKQISDKLYNDTFDVKKYYYDKDLIKYISVNDKWMKGKYLIKYIYNNKGLLLSTYETDSSENYIGNFEVIKYSNYTGIGIKLVYKVSNYNQMVSEMSYSYKADGTLDYYTSRFNGVSTISYLKLNGQLDRFETKDCDGKITSSGNVIYKENNLKDKILYYNFDKDQNFPIHSRTETYLYEYY